MYASWSLGDGPSLCPLLCFVEIQSISVATCTQDRHLWIWIYPWISTQKSVDMDMDGKFHIHGKPASDAGRIIVPRLPAPAAVCTGKGGSL